LPPNLNRIPASAPESTDDGRFASLDRLAESDPVGYERRLAALNEADYQAYMRAQ
jgi:hypothetical protein